MRTNILVVDDEEALCEILKFNLEKEGYDVETANSAEEVLERDDLVSFNLIISDIMMDTLSGYDLVKRIKRNPQTENIPIILCTALDNEDSVVMGLNMGADDYITKPFVKAEVIARVKAVLRRATANTVYVERKTVPASVSAKESDLESDLVFHTLRIDRNQKNCYLDGEEIALTPTEYKLIIFFLTHKNRIYSREEIIDEVWQSAVSGRTVDTNIARLRGKLGEYGKYLETRGGFGYVFKETL